MGGKRRILLTNDQQSAKLDDCEVLPLPVFGLQLVHAAIVSMEEIAAIRDRVMVRSAHRAAGPASAASGSPAATVFAGFFAELDAILNFVLDAREPCGHQPSASLQLFFCHNVLRCNNLAKGFALLKLPLS